MWSNRGAFPTDPGTRSSSIFFRSPSKSYVYLLEFRCGSKSILWMPESAPTQPLRRTRSYYWPHPCLGNREIHWSSNLSLFFPLHLSKGNNNNNNNNEKTKIKTFHLFFFLKKNKCTKGKMCVLDGTLKGVLWCNLLLFFEMARHRRWDNQKNEISFFLSLFVVVFWCGMFQESFTFFPTCRKKKQIALVSQTQIRALWVWFLHHGHNSSLSFVPFLPLPPKKKYSIFRSARERD